MGWSRLLVTILVVVATIQVVSCMTLADQPEVNEIPEDDRVVKTSIGSVSGMKMTSVTGKKVIAYLGIPYAEPPVGDLRFRPPIPLKEPLKEVLRANKEPRSCYQHGPARLLNMMRRFGFSMKRPYTEDCLKLNIYVPEDCPEKASVVVYIHSGGFYMGSATAAGFNGAALAAEEKIIVVTINYRLGALGFLSLHHEEAPGNAGLLDQQLALIFVHNNIAAFGGNPNDVTLAGTSSGSASVGFHILSPASTGLFKKAIMQSGVPTNPWAYGSVETVVKKSYEVATNMGYRGKLDPPNVAKFLRSLDPEELNDGNQYRNIGEENLILPTIDGYLLRKDPDHAIVDAVKEKNITLLIGSSSDEGAIFALIDHPDLFLRYEDSSINFYEYEQIVRDLGFGDEEASAIVNTYVLPEKRGDPHYLRSLATETIGDYLFNCDINEFADYLASQDFVVYRYVYDAKTPLPHLASLPKFFKALHGVDGLLFNGTFLVPEGANVPEPLKEFVDFFRRTTKRYGNFIKHGDPSLEPGDFPRYTSHGGETLLLNPKHEEIIHHPRAKECSIFQHVVPLVETFVNCKRAHRYVPKRIKH